MHDQVFWDPIHKKETIMPTEKEKVMRSTIEQIVQQEWIGAGWRTDLELQPRIDCNSWQWHSLSLFSQITVVTAYLIRFPVRMQARWIRESLDFFAFIWLHRVPGWSWIVRESEGSNRLMKLWLPAEVEVRMCRSWNCEKMWQCEVAGRLWNKHAIDDA